MKIFLFTILLFANVFAAGDAKHPKDVEWPFQGITGSVDRQSAQRGLKVYQEVCAACHSLKRVAYRNLTDIGFSAKEVKAFAKEFTVTDGPNADGDMFDRPAKPSDKFVSPYPNSNAARAANGGALPPDLSLIVKARPNGANYLYSLLTGYYKAPEGFKLNPGMYYNPYFAGKQIAMPAPLSDGQVDYNDNTENSVHQMSVDLVNFLQWAAEPEMEQRKSMGIKSLIYLFIFTILFYFAMKRIWSRVEK